MSQLAGVEIVATDTEESSKEVAVCAYHFPSASGPVTLLQYHRGGAMLTIAKLALTRLAG